MLISTNSGLYSAVEGALRVPMAQSIDFFARAGFEAVDINFAGTIYPEPERHEPILDGDWQRNLDGVLAAIRKNGLSVSHTHVPFYNFAEENEKRRFHDAMTLRALEASAYIGAPYAVIHPHRDENHQTAVPQTVAYLTPFNDFARERGVTLCVENMSATRPEELLAIAGALDCAVCWDAGHANLGGFDQYESVVKLGKRLKVLHLHDNSGAHDEHRPPFMGTVDWKGLVRGLRDAGYEGTFNYEVSAAHVPLPLRMEHARYLVAAAKYLLERA